MQILQIKNLKKSFKKGEIIITAIKNINLSVEEGEFISIVGQSGCGKSTLLHIIGGFINKDEGTVIVGEREVNGPGRDRGIVFQDFALFPWRSVLGNIIWGLEVQDIPKDEQYKKGEEFLNLMDLTKFKNHFPHELSGGMKQRVALARTLAFDPQILLMDEPFGSLDAQTRELMQEELTKICEKTRKTVLFVTHDIEEAIYLGDKVAVFTNRPGTIKQIVEIKLLRPRDIELKKTPEYMGYRNFIWDLLREEALKRMKEE